MKVRMHVIWPLVIGSFALLPTAVATPSKPMTTVSAVPLTTEQVAIYRTVLEDFLKDSKDRLNVANKSEPLDAVSYTHLDVYKRQIQAVGQTFLSGGHRPLNTLRATAESHPSERVSLLHFHPTFQGFCISDRQGLVDSKPLRKR